MNVEKWRGSFNNFWIYRILRVCKGFLKMLILLLFWRGKMKTFIKYVFVVFLFVFDDRILGSLFGLVTFGW